MHVGPPQNILLSSRSSGNGPIGRVVCAIALGAGAVSFDVIAFLNMSILFPPLFECLELCLPSTLLTLLARQNTDPKVLGSFTSDFAGRGITAEMEDVMLEKDWR
eukprot:symbB.v1.2.009525.t1/scaffold606.1/size182035/15